ncbi:MAG: HDOD domain-containing protein [Deltaproteobacteria bacterium]
MSFWAWVRSLFASDEYRAPVRAEPSVSRASIQGGAPAVSRRRPVDPDESVEFDFTEGNEYPADSRVPLTGPERDEVQRLVLTLRQRFDRTKIEAQPFPTRNSRIFALLEDPDFDIDRLVQLTQRDPALSASVLRVASSAVSASLVRIESLREAIVRLGAETVAGIAAALSTRGIFDAGSKTSRGVIRQAWSDAWLHSVSSAFSSGALSIELRRGDLEQCFLGGMLHDIGKTFALRDIVPAWSELGHEGAPSLAVISAVLESVHVDFGSAAARAWKLPAFLVDTVDLHHSPGEESAIEIAIVRLASGLSAIHLTPYYRAGTEDEIRATADLLNIDRIALRACRSDVRTNLRKARAL